MAEKKESTSIWDNSSNQFIVGDFKTYWECLDLVMKYQQECMTDDENKKYMAYALEYVREHVGVKNLRALSLGFSESCPEIEAYLTGMFSKIEVMDIAGGLINKVRQKAKEAGVQSVEYLQRDLNSEVLEKDAYDFIFSVGTVHHIENLEFFFGGINNALKDNGIFVLRDYVGQKRMQLTDEQISIVNEILAVLPEKYKVMHHFGKVKNVYGNMNLKELMQMDPSESIRSTDILPIMGKKLDVIKLSYTGGTLLFPLLDHIASNFERIEGGETILKLLILFEKILIEKKVLPSDYVFCMARKKSLKRKFKEFIFKK